MQVLRFVTAAVGAALLTLSSMTPARADVVSPAKTHITVEMAECDVMDVGTVGSCVISLQTWMNWAVGTKKTVIPIDGVYTEQTRELVQVFQRRYVSSVTPNGRFGVRSRAALARWFERGARRPHGQGKPCNPALGWGCDDGAVVSGLNISGFGKAVKSISCGALGVGVGAVAGAPAGFGSGVWCDLTFE
ncbi:peptidoglycan-binding domain-containing protein [Actinoplanes sp. HUAS TT8]|uniref:peptidoglycan-binding domain-containing protein n=1 Tax=Actinoplanes sp. HUAS TT8 TaxID=3447453 RepID=UPI003F51C757